MSKELFNQMREQEFTSLSRAEKGISLKQKENYDLRFKERNKR